MRKVRSCPLCLLRPVKVRLDETTAVVCRNAECTSLNTAYRSFMPDALGAWNAGAKAVTERRAEYRRQRMHYYLESAQMASCLVGRPDSDLPRRLQCTIVFGKVNCRFCRKRGPNPEQERALRDRRTSAHARARTGVGDVVTTCGNPRLDGAD